MRPLFIAGVLLLTLLTFYSALWFKSETIEADITKRVTEDLAATNAKDIDIGVDGRHVTLSGVVYDAATEEAYLGTADETYGALGPIDGLTMRDGGGYLKAVKSADGITLTGAVPSDAARTALLDAATASTDGEVTDAMTVGAAEGAWTDEAGFGLAQMAGLSSGALSVTPDNYTLSGTTEGDAASVRAPLADRAGWQSFVSAPTVETGLNDQLAKLNADVSGLEGQVEALTGDIAERDTTIGELSAERDTLSTSLTAMTLARDEALDQGDATTADIIAERDALAADLEGANAARGVLSETVTGLTGERDALAAKLESANATRGVLSATVAGLSAENGTLKQSVATLTTERDTALTDLDNLRASLDDTQSSTAALRGQLSEAQAQVAERDVTIEGLNGEVADLKGQLETQTTSMNAGQQEDAAVRAQIAEQSGTIDTLTADVAARGETILRLQGQNDTLADEVDASTAMVQERDATVADLQARLTAAQSGTATTANVAAPTDMAAQCGVRAGAILENAQINFSSGTANIRSNSVETLERLTGVALACSNDNLTVEIGGHTDSQGSDESNQSLSERRAQAVAQFMIDRGVNAETLKPVGYGEAQPIGDNDTREGRQANRRISFEWQAR